MADEIFENHETVNFYTSKFGSILKIVENEALVTFTSKIYQTRKKIMVPRA